MFVDFKTLKLSRYLNEIYRYGSGFHFQFNHCSNENNARMKSQKGVSCIILFDYHITKSNTLALGPGALLIL